MYKYQSIKLAEAVNPGCQYGPAGISQVPRRVWEVLVAEFCIFIIIIVGALLVLEFSSSYKVFGKYLYGRAFTIVFRILAFTLFYISPDNLRVLGFWWGNLMERTNQKTLVQKGGQI